MAHSEKDAIIKAVMKYTDGIRTANAESLNDAFYSSVNLSSLSPDGDLVLTPKDALIAYATGPDIPANKSEILDVDIVNDMAMVKVKIDMPEFHFFDFLTLLKMNVGWKIVSKTYTTVMK